MKPALLVAALLALCPLAPTVALARQATPEAHLAQAASDLEVARRYQELMMANDQEAQLAMLSEDAVFEDPMVTLSGRAAIAAAWRDQRIRLLSYESGGAFHSGRGQVVLSGVVRFEQTFRTQTGEPLTLAFETPSIMVLTIQGETVVRHIDYVDTAAFATQLQAHIRRLQAGA